MKPKTKAKNEYKRYKRLAKIRKHSKGIIFVRLPCFEINAAEYEKWRMVNLNK